MKNKIIIVITTLIVIAGSILGFVFSPGINDLQVQTLKVLAIICGSGALYCFIVGELARNNSQMDKLWSILPIAYVWVVAGMGGWNARLIVIAVIVTLWGIRLTFNFARKGAYSIKFWAGEEDYRWVVLRQNKILGNRVAWAAFDLFFISIYQNALVLAMTLPIVACMSSTEPFGVLDYVFAAMAVSCLVLETVADEQQWKFHQKKKELAESGLPREEFPEPYNKGFNTFGLWKMARHPNYFGEQAIWVCLYLFCISAKVTNYGVFNWSMFGCLFIILLFLGSSAFGESVSSSKYPEYQYYQKEVSKYIPNPFRKYKR